MHREDQELALIMLAGMLVQMVKMLESRIKHGYKADSLSATLKQGSTLKPGFRAQPRNPAIEMALNCHVGRDLPGTHAFQTRLSTVPNIFDSSTRAGLTLMTQ